MKLSKNFWPILGLIFIIISFTLVFRNKNLISQILLASGGFAPLVALILYPLMAMTPVPTEPITLITAATYGPFVSALLAGFGNVMATLLEYYVGFHLKTPLNIKKPKKINSPTFLIFGRMIPGYGSKIVSFLAGATHCPLRLYIWTSAVTSFAAAFSISYGSFGLLSIFK